MRFKLSKSKDKTRINADEEGDNLVLQISGQEKQDDNRTKATEQAGEQLKQDSEDEHAPHKPIQELEFDPANDEDVEPDEDTPLSTELAEESGEEIKLVEIGSAELSGVNPEKDKAEAGKTEPKPPETATTSGSSSLDDFFSDDEEEINPLAALIAAVPNVSVKELMDDLQEIKEIIKDWEHK